MSPQALLRLKRIQRETLRLVAIGQRDSVLADFYRPLALLHLGMTWS